MARYVDIDKAVEEARLNYCKNCNNYNGVKCRACAFDDAMLEIESTPEADVVEVVRCKDCFHYTIINGTCLLLSCKEQTVRVYEDDYCSNGLNKRKVNYCTDKQNNLRHCEDCHESC